jgi:hypothetical protein
MNGTFTSPYYPSNYVSNLNCVWKISVPPENRIRLSFNDLQTEQTHDCVYVYDGESSLYNIIGTFCGRLYSLPSTSVISTTNFMTVRFKTDGSVTNSGFSAVYRAVNSSKFLL